MEFLDKSISSSFKNINPYITSKDNEVLLKSYSERDIFHISNKFISKEEWDSIFTFISKSPNFHTLSISGINIDSYGLRRVAEVIGANNSIKTLKLEWNYLNEYNEDFDYLCEVISRSNNIIYLHLNNNKLNSMQANSISKVIRNNSAIYLIDLRWNEIGNDGGKEISAALTSNSVLQEMNLTGNKITQEILFEINDKINRNKNYVYNLNFNHEKIKNEYTSKAFPYLSEKINLDNKDLYFFKGNKEDVLLNNTVDLNSEYKARYDSLLLTNTNLEKRVKELEIVLNNSKSNSNEYKSSITKDIQNLKDVKHQLEEELLRRKEENMLKELEQVGKLNEFEHKISKLNQEKQDLIHTNEQLHNQLETIQVSLNEKYKMLEAQYEKNNEFHISNYNDLKEENEKLRKDLSNEMKTLSNTSETKYKSLDDENKKLLSTINELTMENNHLKRELSELKILKEVEWNERESRIKEEETRKKENIIKEYDNKFRNFHLFKDELERNSSRLVEEMEELRKSFQEEKHQLERKVDEQHAEIAHITKHLGDFQQKLNKANAELELKESFNMKLKEELNEANTRIKQNFDKSNLLIQDISTQGVKERQHWEEEVQEKKFIIEDLKSDLVGLKDKVERMTQDREDYKEKMKRQVSKIIEERFREIHLE